MRVRVAGRPHVRVLFHLPEKIGKGFFFFFSFQRRKADERRRNPGR